MKFVHAYLKKKKENQEKSFENNENAYQKEN